MGTLGRWAIPGRATVVGLVVLSGVVLAAFVLGGMPDRDAGLGAALRADGIGNGDNPDRWPRVSDPTAPTETTFDWYRIRGVAAEGSRIRVYRDRDRDGVPDFVAPLGMTAVAPGASEFVVRVPLEVGEHRVLLTVAGTDGEHSFSIPTITRKAVKDWCDCLPGVVRVVVERGARIEVVLEGVETAEVERSIPWARTVREGGGLTEDKLSRSYYVTVAPGTEREVMLRLRRHSQVAEVGRVEFIEVG